MKNINVKKVVAGAAALALGVGVLGVAIAGNNSGDTFGPVVKGDVYTTSTMQPKVSIVTGVNGDDDQWAQNIANAIATSAKKRNPQYDAWVPTPSTPGTTTDDGTLFDDDDMGFDLDDDFSVKYTKYNKLFDGDIEYYDHDDTKKTLKNVKETMDVNVSDVYFEADEDVQAVIAKIPAGTAKYTLNLGSTGIKVTDTSATDYTLNAGGQHDIEIPFMGKTYKIRSITEDKITLVEQENKLIYREGGVFVIDDYTVEVSTITQDRVLLLLKQGSSQVGSQSLREGKSTTFNGKISEITVTEVNYADNQQGYVEISQGNAVLELNNGEEIEDFTGEDEREWTANWDETFTADHYLKEIRVTDTDGWSDVGENADFPALKIGDSADFPNDLGSVKFVGLTDETMYDFEITSNKTIKWSDYKYTYEVPLFLKKAFTTGSESKMKFAVDNKDYYLIRDVDGNYTVSETSDEDEFIAGAHDVAAGTDVTIVSDLTSGTSHQFRILANSNDTEMAIAFKGTDGNIGKKGTFSITGGDKTDYFDGFNTGSDRNATIFTIKDVDTAPKDINFSMDTKNFKLADEDVMDNFTGPKVKYANDNWKFNLNDEDDDDIQEGYTATGGVVKIANGYINVSLPEDPKKYELFIGGVITTPGDTEQTNPYHPYIETQVNPSDLLKKDVMEISGTKIVVGGHLVNKFAEGITEDSLVEEDDFIVGKHANSNIYVAGWTKADTGTAASELINVITSWPIE